MAVKYIYVNRSAESRFRFWTLIAEIERRIQALEMRCYRRSEYFLHRPCDERGGSQQNPECNWSAWWSPNHGKGNSDDIDTSQDPRAWRRQFCRGQWKEQEGEESRRRDGKITSMSGQEWGLEIPWGQRKTGKGGKALLQRHLGCPDDLRG